MYGCGEFPEFRAICISLEKIHPSLNNKKHALEPTTLLSMSPSSSIK
jgi:hypothetical protein